MVLKMESLKVTGFIVAYFSSYTQPGDPPSYSFQQYEPVSENFITICPWETVIEFAVAENQVPARVAALKAAIIRANLEAAERCAELDERLQKLLALEAPV